MSSGEFLSFQKYNKPKAARRKPITDIQKYEKIFQNSCANLFGSSAKVFIAPNEFFALAIKFRNGTPNFFTIPPKFFCWKRFFRPQNKVRNLSNKVFDFPDNPRSRKLICRKAASFPQNPNKHCPKRKSSVESKLILWVAKDFCCFISNLPVPFLSEINFQST